MSVLRSVILQAKLAQLPVSIQTLDGEILTGIIEKLTSERLMLRLSNGVMFVPVRDIENVTYG